MSEVARINLTLPGRDDRCEIRAGRGLLRELPAVLSALAPAHRYAIISDETVAGHWAGPTRRVLEDAGLSADLFTFPAGEANKRPDRWETLAEAMASGGHGRDSAVIALGGGVTGDLAGFVAATFARGIPLIQLPTSLLAMIDASIGGKTGLDLAHGKNLVGAFHQPRAVVADLDFLETLPQEELRGGLAEAVKHGAIADAAYFDWLGRSATSIVERDAESLDRLVADSIRVKTAHVARDVAEAGVRAVLNFGHTVGHAVERLSDYTIPHGEAVAMGMVAEAGIGEVAGVTEPGTEDRIREVLASLGLPTAPPAAQVDAAGLVEAARTDKKARAGATMYVLLSGIGSAARASDGGWTHAVPDAMVTDVLQGLLRTR